MNKDLKTNFGSAASCLDVDQYYTEEWQSVLAGRVECFDHCERQKRNAASCLDVDQYYRGVAEWSNAAVLKTVVPRGTGGSNPSSSAFKESNPTKTLHTKCMEGFFFSDLPRLLRYSRRFSD